jgi:hypothetical protein
MILEEVGEGWDFDGVRWQMGQETWTQRREQTGDPQRHWHII